MDLRILNKFIRLRPANAPRRRVQDLAERATIYISTRSRQHLITLTEAGNSFSWLAWERYCRCCPRNRPDLTWYSARKLAKHRGDHREAISVSWRAGRIVSSRTIILLPDWKNTAGSLLCSTLGHLRLMTSSSSSAHQAVLAAARKLSYWHDMGATLQSVSCRGQHLPYRPDSLGVLARQVEGAGNHLACY